MIVSIKPFSRDPVQIKSGKDEDISHVGKRGVIGNDPREPYLLIGKKEPKAQ